MSQVIRMTDLAFALLRASQVMDQVLVDGQSLDRVLKKVLADVSLPQACGAIQDLAYCGLRGYGQGLVLSCLLTGREYLSPRLLDTFLPLCFVLLLDENNPKYAPHVLVDQAVQACGSHSELKRAKGFVNACLRNFLRDRQTWLNKAKRDALFLTGFPSWWVTKLQVQHPNEAAYVMAQANTHPPMALRVNARVSTAADYSARLTSEGIVHHCVGQQSIVLEHAVPVTQLPGFELGHVSVQDLAAQMAAPLLNLQDGQRVLDACAAPGGKTGHILELSNVNLVALDVSQTRLNRVRENVSRLSNSLGFEPNVNYLLADASKPLTWWDGQPFDAILLDLPCSGSGVVRRHPDIRWLRRESDIEQLSLIQHTILNALWSALKVNGTLVVATCSIFSEEGSELAAHFMKSHSDAQALSAPGEVWPQVVESLPQPWLLSPDGFFYARFTKKIS